MRSNAKVRSIVSCGLKCGKVLSNNNGVNGIDEGDTCNGGKIEIVLHERLVIPDDLSYFLFDGVNLLVKHCNHLVQTFRLFFAYDLLAVHVADPVLDIELAFPVQVA